MGSNNHVVIQLGMTSARTNTSPCLRLTPGNGIASSMDNNTGVMKDTLQLTVWDTHKANAVTNTSLNILRAATGCISIGIAQIGIQPNVKSSQCIHNGVITRVNDHRGL